ncbi:MAG: lamin tail domain-containing protein [Candidatus Vogelbacteria bacterium]|nr:lamin tail domain-containing protein [Candidatus Vogelbacteria bacterium]
MKRVSLLLIAAMIVPAVSSASVQINEIAWMGSASNSNAEWIELYNPDETMVVLDGWTLNWGLNLTTPRIVKLAGSIGARAYYLLERTSDETVGEKSADMIYVGALSNSGETLILKDTSGTVIDKVDGGDGWKIGGETVVGNNSTKETAQRGSNGWITATGTPEAANSADMQAVVMDASIDTDKDGGSGGTSAASNSRGQRVDSSEKSVDPDDQISAHDSSAPVTISDRIKQSLVASAGRARIGLTRSPMSFSATAYDEKGKPVTDTQFAWSFGDDTTGEGALVKHTYLHKGHYTLILNASKNGIEAIGRTSVIIDEPRLKVASVTAGDNGSMIEVLNQGSTEVNLGGWKIISGVGSFTLPKDTLIGSGERLIFPNEITKLTIGDGRVGLMAPDGTDVLGSHYKISKTEESKIPSTTPVAPIAITGRKPVVAVGATTTPKTPSVTSRFDHEKKLAQIQADAIAVMLAIPDAFPKDGSASLQKIALKSEKNTVRATQEATGDGLQSVETVDAVTSEVSIIDEIPKEKRIVVVPKPRGVFDSLNAFLERVFGK